MTSGPFHLVLRDALASFYEDGSWKCMLLSNYVVDRDTHRFRSDIQAFELPAAGGYTLGGVAVLAPTVIYNSSMKLYTITMQAGVVPNSTLSATHAAWYKVTGNPATERLGYINNFNGTIISDVANFNIPACDFRLGAFN